MLVLQNTLVDTSLQLIRGRDRKCNPPGGTNLRSKKRIRDYRNDLFVFSFRVDARGARRSDIPHPRHVYRVEFIRERCYAIGRWESIIYLGNYSEAGSMPPGGSRATNYRMQAFVVFGGGGRACPARRESLNPLYNPS